MMMMDLRQGWLLGGPSDLSQDRPCEVVGKEVAVTSDFMAGGDWECWRKRKRRRPNRLIKGCRKEESPSSHDQTLAQDRCSRMDASKSSVKVALML